MFRLQGCIYLTTSSYTYEISKMIANILFTGAIVLLIVIILLFVNIRKRTIAENVAEQTKKKLEENYVELEAAYGAVTNTQKELSTKFEELQISERKNKKLAYTDYLIELPNRNAFTEMLDNIMTIIRKEEVVAFMYIDLDNFKNINDTLGHSYGDELLIDVSHRIKQVLDENDYLARFGGDEFIILSQNIEDVGMYEEKIKRIQTVFSYPFVLASKEFFVTISVGISLAPKDGKTTHALIKNVDSAMYLAKERGKNKYCYYDESINKKLMNRIETQSELRNAIKDKEFVIYYQAQIDLKMNQIVGFEALIRWNHPTRGLLLPIDFISLAEETGLIVPIGKWVLSEACRKLREWENEGYKDITMAVNLSARQFRDADIVEMVKEIIEETGIDPHRLELEITESIALDNIDYSVATIQQLREIGVTFSLDDFGTGYSSMNYLKLLPVSNLKIDKSFLDTIMDNQNEQKIVSMIIALAQTLNLVVIAEGVEKSDQADFLKKANCNKAQGYLYSKPISAMDAESLLITSSKPVIYLS